jgi:hypothetical protein
MNVRENFQKDIFKLKGLQTPLFTRMKWKGRCALDIAINNRLLKALPLGSALVQNYNNPHTHECADVMASFSKICNSVSVPIADDKTEGPTTSMEYLGLLIDTPIESSATW